LNAGGELPATVLSIPETVLFMSAGFPAVIVLTGEAIPKVRQNLAEI